MIITRKIKTLQRGWDERKNFKGIYGILIHTTNGGKDSLFTSEIDYLLTANVTAHYIISKRGEIVQLLDIDKRAWHAGSVYDQQYNNNNSIGIELHYTPGESKNLAPMFDSCRSLCRMLVADYKIAGIRGHREEAKPEGRKVDPSCWSIGEFNTWRDITLCTRQKRLIKKHARLWTSPDFNHPVAEHINDQEIERGIFLRTSEREVIRITTGWYWITNGIGFVESRNVA